MRLFFAVVPDDAACHDATAVADLLRRDPELRRAPIAWVADDHFHVTLAFFGEVTADRVSGLLELASRPFPQPPVCVELVSVGVFPPRGAGRVVWLGPSAASGRMLMRLHHALWQRLDAHGWRDAATRFHPHVTLGRVRRFGRVAGLRLAVAGVSPPPVSWTARQVTLYESRLSSGGASYHVVAQAPLTGA